MLIRLIAQTHLDPVFMWNWEEGLASTISTVKSVIHLLSKYPDLKFCRSDGLFYLWIEQSNPELIDQIKALVKQERWILVGNWFTQADCAIPSGESLLRQAYYGQKILDRMFGIRPTIAWLIDSSGLPATLPKILKYSGLKYLVISRPPEDRIKLPAPLFDWISDDGSSVLTFRIPIGYSTYADEVKRIKQVHNLCPEWLDQIMCFFGLGNHGGGPTEEQIKRIIEFAKSPESPELVFSSPYRFFEDVEDNPSIPKYKGCLEKFVIGNYANELKLKQLHDIAQFKLILAEKFSAIVNILKADNYKHLQIDNLWEDFLYTEFHDILPGTSIEPALEDSKNILGGIISKADRIKTFALRRISNLIDTNKEGYVKFIVFNNTNLSETFYFEYEPWLIWQDWEDYRLVDEEGKEVPHQQTWSAPAAPGHTRLIIKTNLPANGYKLLRVIGPKPDLAKIGPGFTKAFKLEPKHIKSISTPRYKIEFKDDNTIGKLIDSANTDLAKNNLIDWEILDDKSDTFAYYKLGYGKAEYVLKPSKPLLTEQGPLRWSIKRKYVYNQSELTETMRIFDESELILFDLQLFWKERWKLLKCRINLPFRKGNIYSGLAFGKTKRTEESIEFPYQNWILAKSADKSYPLRELAIIAGAGLHSADIVENSIRLTIIRSPVYCHEEINNQKYTPGPEHKFMNQRRFNLRFAILPIYEESSIPKLIELSNGLIENTSLITTFTHEGNLPPAGKFLSVEPDNIYISSIRKSSNDESYIIRLIEYEGKQSEGLLHWFNEDFRFTINPFAILTLKLTNRDGKWSLNTIGSLLEE